MNCDFCSEARPSWLYPARAVRLTLREALGQVESLAPTRPGWLACGGCYEAIQSVDPDQLLARALEQLELPGEPTMQLPLRRLHAIFWSTRSGPPRRLPVTAGCPEQPWEGETCAER